NNRKAPRKTVSPWNKLTGQITASACASHFACPPLGSTPDARLRGGHPGNRASRFIRLLTVPASTPRDKPKRTNTRQRGIGRRLRHRRCRTDRAGQGEVIGVVSAQII